MEQDSPGHESYDDQRRSQEYEAGIQIAFILGRFLSEPGHLVEVQIADKELEIEQAIQADSDPQMLCALQAELRQLKLIRLEAEEVSRNSHTETTTE